MKIRSVFSLQVWFIMTIWGRVVDANSHVGNGGQFDIELDVHDNVAYDVASGAGNVMGIK